MKTMQRLLLTGCLLMAGSLVALAQEKPATTAPHEGTFKVMAAKPVTTKTVKGAPYSATALIETVQTLSDGNQIIRKNESKLYRDGEGRTRAEQTLKHIGNWTAEGEASQIIAISDPVAGWSASLDPRAHTAQKVPHPASKPVNVEWHESFTVNGKPVTQAEFEAIQKGVNEKKTPTGEAAPTMIPSEKAKAWERQEGVSGDPRKKIEQLGKQMIEGVETIGTRSTYTIPVGEIGNTLPIAIVEETWYSPELDLMVLTKNRDPRSGETTYRLTNLNRSEPDRALFEIPTDYTFVKSPFPVKKKPVKEEE